MKKTVFLPLLATAALGLAACGDNDALEAEDTAMADAEANAMADPAMDAGTIVEVAQGNPDFSTLVAAVQAADLGSTLSGPGPYTVFAPTNSAFDALPAGTVEELTTTQTEQLGEILTYHVVEGDINSATLIAAIEAAGEGGHPIPTVNGGELTARLVGGEVQLTDAAGNTATVVQTDVEASNGVVHAIDTVMMPS